MPASSKYKPGRSISFSGQHAKAGSPSETNGLLDNQSSGLSPLPSLFGSPRGSVGSDDLGLFRQTPTSDADEHLEFSRRNVIGDVKTAAVRGSQRRKKKPSWPNEQPESNSKTEGARTLSRRHSISLDFPATRELSKIKGVSTQTSVEGKPTFEFVCSAEFRAKYETYLGLDKEAKSSKGLSRKLLHRVRESLKPKSQAAGAGSAINQPMNMTPAVEVSVQELLKTKKFGLCQICRHTNGVLVPQRMYLAEPTDSSKCVKLDQQQRTPGENGSRSSKSLPRPRPSSVWHPERSESPDTQSQAPAKEKTDLSKRTSWPRWKHRQSTRKRMLFLLDRTCSSENLWISSRGYIALSLAAEQQLLCQPGFKEGEHSWRFIVMPSSSVPNKLVESPKDKHTDVNDQQSPSTSKRLRNRTTSNGSDYAIPYDALTESEAANGKEQMPDLSSDGEHKTNTSLTLSVGLCLRSYVPDRRSALRATMEETAAVHVLVKREEKETTLHPLRRTTSIIQRFSQRAHSPLVSDDEDGAEPSLMRTEDMTIVRNQGMLWNSGDTGTVCVSCTEQCLTVTNHNTGEVYGLPLGGMVAYNNVVDTESSDDESEQESVLDFEAQEDGLRASRPQHLVRSKWLHPYFVLHDRGMVLAIVQDTS